MKFFCVDVESVAQLCNNTTHATKNISSDTKKKPRGLVDPGAIVKETSVKKLATAITSEKSI
jgi:hypothetical protein